MPFSLNVIATPPPRPHFPWPLRALAWLLRRASVAVAIIAVWQRAVLRRVYGVRWQLGGTCQSCGRCCENLMLEVGKGGVWRRFWHEQVFDFYPKETVFEGLRAYGCRNFTAERTCAKYPLRPFVCRIYPALALYQEPRVRAHCGFHVLQD